MFEFRLTMSHRRSQAEHTSTAPASLTCIYSPAFLVNNDQTQSRVQFCVPIQRRMEPSELRVEGQPAKQDPPNPTAPQQEVPMPMAATDNAGAIANEDKTTMRGWRFWGIIVSLGICGLASAIEGTIITSALPTITRALGGGNSYVVSKLMATGPLEPRDCQVVSYTDRVGLLFHTCACLRHLLTLLPIASSGYRMPTCSPQSLYFHSLAKRATSLVDALCFSAQWHCSHSGVDSAAEPIQ